MPSCPVMDIAFAPGYGGRKNNRIPRPPQPPDPCDDANTGTPACCKHVVGSQLDYRDTTSDGRCNKGAFPGNGGMMSHHPPCRAQAFSCNLVYRIGGSLLDSRPGSLLQSTEVLSDRNGRIVVHLVAGYDCIGW